MDRTFAFGTDRTDLGTPAARGSKVSPLFLFFAVVVLTIGAVLTADALHLSLPVVDEFGAAVLGATL